MSERRVIDISVLPMTFEVRDTYYVVSDQLEAGFRSIWDRAFTPESLVGMMDSSGVEQILMPAHTGGEWAVPYDLIARICADYPDRILGQAGIDPRNIADGVRLLEHGVRELGFVGAHSYPHWFQLSPDDRSYYPFYAKCVELDVPIQIQIGKAWQTRLRSVGTPGAIDQVAVDFPELRVIAIHTGYPWERELVSVASKHPNVFIGADAMHPGDWAPEIVQYIRNESPQSVMAGRDKVLFGTNYPALSGAEAFEDTLRAVEQLGFDDLTLHHLLHKNAERVYKLGGAPPSQPGRNEPALETGGE